MGCKLTTEEVAHIDQTIADLRDENDRLRELVHWLKRGDILHVLTDQEYIDQCERERLMQVSIDALDKENDKLRELVRDLWARRDSLLDFGFYAEVAEQLDKLGIEVDA